MIVDGIRFPVNSAWLSEMSSVFAEMIKSDEKVGISADDYMINGVESAVYFEEFLALISPRPNLLPEQQILPNRMDLLICKLYSSGKGRL